MVEAVGLKVHVSSGHAALHLTNPLLAVLVSLSFKMQSTFLNAGNSRKAILVRETDESENMIRAGFDQEKFKDQLKQRSYCSEGERLGL
jgi:hypothetical protein